MFRLEGLTIKKITLITLISALSIFWTSAASAANLSDIKQQKAQTQNKLKNLYNQQNIAKKNLQNAVSKNRALEKQNQEVSNEHSNLVIQKTHADQELISAQCSLENAKRRCDEQQNLLKRRLRNMYENSFSPSMSFLNVICNSKNISDFLTRIEILSAIAHKDQQLAVAVRTAKEDVQFKMSEKSRIARLMQERVSCSLVSLNQIKASKEQLQTKIGQINSTLSELEEQEDALLRKSNELEAQIKAFQNPSHIYSGGSMVWPTPSCCSISSPFGMRMHPIFKKYKIHTGIDIPASYGSSIVSANSGTVVIAGWQEGYGSTVVIDHGGGISTLYAHCSRILVSAGQSVRSGDTIAKVGSTGFSTGAHLHF